MRRQHDLELSIASKVNLTPLMDVVFILLIFFVVTSSFVKESGIEVERPAARTAVVQERANIIVAITDSGDIWVDGQRVDIYTVRTQIEGLRAENPEGAVVIQADAQSRTGLAIEVLDQIRLAGVTNVAFAASAIDAR